MSPADGATRRWRSCRTCEGAGCSRCQGEGGRWVAVGPRRFRCCGCGHAIPPGQARRLVGVRVRRRRRVLQGEPGFARPGWAEVEVEATARYPAHVCRACADAFGAGRDTV